MKLLSILIIINAVLFVIKIESIHAFPAPNALESQNIVNYLILCQPGKKLKDVTDRFGKPFSIEGNSYQWNLNGFAMDEKDQRIFYEGTAVLNIIIKNTIVDLVEIFEIVYDDNDINKQRIDEIFHIMNNRYGDPKTTEEEVIWDINSKLEFALFSANLREAGKGTYVYEIRKK